MRCFKWILVMCVLVAAAVSVKSADDKPETKEPTRHQRIYYFEHRLLPRWTFESDGRFYEDLKAGKLDRLKDAAGKIVDKEFAAKIVVSGDASPAQVMITFDPPSDSPLCYYVILKKSGGGYGFYTLERTEDLMGIGVKTMVCGWSPEGSHNNYGGRKYTDAATFSSEIEKMGDPKPSAVTSFGAKEEEKL